MATLKSPYFMFLFLTVLIASFAIEYSDAVGGRKQNVGGWEPIKDPKDAYILEIGKFAIDEHNTEAKTSLEFETVVKGDEQVVAGMNYRLYIEARDKNDDVLTTHQYEAVVYDRPFGQKVRELTSFKQLEL